MNLSDISTKLEGSGTATYLSKFTNTRVLANSSIQEDAFTNVGVGGSPHQFFKMRVQGVLIVDDSASPNGIVLGSTLANRPLISRQLNSFTSGKPTNLGR